jgi:glucose-6-phosphate 1-dehydrogenase
MAGENLLFAREDGVEKAWKVVDHVVYHHHQAHPYKVHTWGPSQAGGLIQHHQGWHDPVL